MRLKSFLSPRNLSLLAISYLLVWVSAGVRADTTIDDWTTAHAQAATFASTGTEDEDAAVDMIGTERDIETDREVGANSFAVISEVAVDSGKLQHTEAISQAGRSRISWDGNDSAVSGSWDDTNIDTDGLVSADLTVAGCSTANSAFSFTIDSSSSNRDFDLYLDIWEDSDGTKYTQSKTFNTDSLPLKPSFAFSSFSGADMTDIGAIRLAIDPNNANTGVSLEISSPFIATCGFDYGDAPDTYSTLNSSGGPSHKAINSGPFIGVRRADVEDDGVPGTGADGDDDIVGVLADNGITIRTPTSDGNHNAFVDVLVGGVTGGTVTVCAWFDIPAEGVGVDGVFNMGSEQQCNTRNSDGTESFEWQNLPADQSYDTYVRARVCTTAAECNSPTGATSASDGEVDDLGFSIDLSSTRAVIGDAGVDVFSTSELLTRMAGGKQGLKNRATILQLLAQWDSNLADSMAHANINDLRQAVSDLLDPDGDGITAVFHWETLEERGTLGFHVERNMPEKGWQRVNASLLPGMVASPRGGEYFLPVSDTLVTAAMDYRIVEIDTNGRSHQYGPWPMNLQIRSVSEVFGEQTTTAQDSNGALPMKGSFGLQGLSRGFVGRPTHAEFARPSPPVRTHQSNAGGRANAHWLYTRADGLGLYQLPVDRLAEMFSLNPNQLRVWLSQGRKLEVRNETEVVPWFYDEVTEALSFVASGHETLYSYENAYRLRQSNGPSNGQSHGQNNDPGITMSRVEGNGPGISVSDEVIADQVTIEQDNFAKPDIIRHDTQADYWFWDFLYPNLSGHQSINLPLSLPGQVASAGGATLEVHLQGMTDVLEGDDHQVSAWFDGEIVGQTSWDKAAPASIEFTLDSNQLALVEAGEPLRLSSANLDTVQWLDRVEVSYFRSMMADSGRLLARQLGVGLHTAGGFTNSDIIVIELANDQPRLREDVTVTPSADGYQVSFMADTKADYLLYQAGSAAIPVTAVDYPSDILDMNKVDYLVIAPRQLAASAEALWTYRKQQFKHARIAWLDDIYDEFSHGRADAAAIDEFLDYAASEWKLAPEYVTLMGRGTLDHRDILGFSGSMIPVQMEHTPWGLVASDYRFASLGDTLVYALGRIPVSDNTQGLAYVDKLKTWENAVLGDWSSTAVLVADNPDQAGDFHFNTDALSLGLEGAGFDIKPIYHCLDGNVHAACSDVADDLSKSTTWEVALFNYDGHGAHSQIGDFTENFMNTAVAADLDNEVQPIFLAFTCSAGDTSSPAFPSLTGALVRNPHGGAIAAISPAGQSLDVDAQILSREIYNALSQGDSIGVAMVNSLNTVKGFIVPFMERVYNVIGEPAVQVP